MKEKKIFLSLFLIIIFLSLIFFTNIGHATNSITTSTNQYSPNTSNLDITFYTDSSYWEKLNIINDTTISFENIDLKSVNEKQKLQVPIKNNSSLNSYKIDLDVKNSNTEYFEVTTSNSIILKPNQISIIELTIKLKKIPINTTETTKISIDILSETIYE